MNSPTTVVPAPDLDGIVERFREERPLLASWCDYVVSLLSNDADVGQLRPITVKGRLKDEQSLKEKVIEKHSGSRVITPRTLFHEIEDLAGARIVLAQKRHVSHVVARVNAHAQEGTWDIVGQKHYVWHPDEVQEVEHAGVDAEHKPFAYCSRHFILARPGTDYDSDHVIKCELQVRTVLEEAMFENDHRIRYKKKHARFTSTVLSRLSEILQSADQFLADAYDLAEWEREHGP
jgi:ppGpp synthetase/RelA/SpoT-type nucleotidyltranferase